MRHLASAPAIKLVEPVTTRRALRSLAPYLWPKGEIQLKFRVVAALICLAFAKVATVSVPLIYKNIIDRLGGGAVPVTNWLNTLGLSIAGLVMFYGLLRVFGQSFGELRDAIFAKVTQRAVRELGLKAFRHLHGLSLRFHLDRQTGGLSRAVERGAKSIEFLLDFTLFSVLPTIVELIFVAAILLHLYPPIFAAVVLVTILCYIVFTISITEWRTKYRLAMNERDTEASSRAVDSLLNYETVKYFNNEAHEAERYGKSLTAYERAAVKSATTLSLLNIGQGFIIAVGLIVMMVLAAAQVRQGVMSIGDFVLINSYLLQLYMPLNQLGFVYRQIRQSLTDMDQMFALLLVDQEVRDAPGAPALAVSRGEVVFDQVEFGYDPRRQILHGLSFRIPPGRTIAVVGESGAGKSTLSRLLYRFYDISGGRILIDGQETRSVTQASLRRAIGIVPQDTVLFNDTIYYNIHYGRPGASPGEIEEAARLARIHDFIMRLPDQYQTRVGERGLKLSGGEKQRVAIARVILKQPQILIFDEATSALDTKTEKEIQVSLTQVARDHTTLIIAHRLSTVIDADEIIVLDAGRIVERGSHAVLLKLRGIYFAMWTRQQEALQREEMVAPHNELVTVE